MPQAAIVAGIGAAGALGGGILSSRASNRATRAQERAQAEALAFQRDLEARRQAEFDRAEAERKAAWDAEQARREPFRVAAENILRRQGYSGGLSRPTMPAGWQAGDPTSMRRPSPTFGTMSAPRDPLTPPLTAPQTRTFGSY